MNNNMKPNLLEFQNIEKNEIPFAYHYHDDNYELTYNEY